MDSKATPNFQILIADLQAAGLSITDIANTTGATQPGITRLKNGASKEPLYTLGERLVRLHNKEMHLLRRKRAAFTNEQKVDTVKKEKASPHCAS